MKRETNPNKAAKVKGLRGATPEEVATEGRLVDTKVHPAYPDQLIEIYLYKDYAWALIVGLHPPRYITAYRSRKLKKEYGL